MTDYCNFCLDHYFSEVTTIKVIHWRDAGERTLTRVNGRDLTNRESTLYSCKLNFCPECGKELK